MRKASWVALLITTTCSLNVCFAAQQPAPATHSIQFYDTHN